VILVDRGWTPADAEQAEDRAHRLGTRHNVTSIWLQYGAIDERIDQLLQLKQERIEIMLTGKPGYFKGIPSIRALAKEILESAAKGVSLAQLLDLDPKELEQKAVDLVRDDIEPEQMETFRKKDGRLKGKVKRVRMNIMLDEEVADFLRSMKTSAQSTTQESGYSGFLEELVRKSEQFRASRRTSKS
jgi:hypothetical protein